MCTHRRGGISCTANLENLKPEAPLERLCNQLRAMLSDMVHKRCLVHTPRAFLAFAVLQDVSGWDPPPFASLLCRRTLSTVSEAPNEGVEESEGGAESAGCCCCCTRECSHAAACLQQQELLQQHQHEQQRQAGQSPAQQLEPPAQLQQTDEQQQQQEVIPEARPELPTVDGACAASNAFTAAVGSGGGGGADDVDAAAVVLELVTGSNVAGAVAEAEVVVVALAASSESLRASLGVPPPSTA